MILKNNIKYLTTQALASVIKRKTNSQKISGTPCGLEQLDKKISGFQPGGIYIVAARPGAGKTSFAVNALIHSALNLKRPSMFYSAFNNETEVIERVLSQITEIPLSNISSGRLSENQCKTIEEAAELISQSKIHIEFLHNLNAEEIFQQAIRFCKLHKTLSLLVIDGLSSSIRVDAGPEFLRFSSKKEDLHRNRKIEGFLMQLSFWAKKLACPIVITWPIDPQIDQRKNKRPRLSDLHLSAGMEDFTDAALILHREDVYKYEWQRNNIAEIFIARNRLGETGYIHTNYSDKTKKFTNLKE